MTHRITIIGNGRVGGSIAHRLRNKNADVTLVSHAEFEAWLHDGDVGTVLILAVKDAHMQGVIASVAAEKGETLRDVVAFHVNGSRGSAELAPWADKGAKVGAAHPFQTFAEVDPSALDGIGWGVEASEQSWTVIKDLVQTMGGHPVRLDDTSEIGKRRYHAAAVAASNFAYAAYELGRRLADSVHIDADVFLVPIMKRTFENAADALHDEDPFGVTGPLVRGDVEGVRQQIDAIPDDLKDMYRHLSLALLEVVKDRLDGDVTTELRRLLDTTM
jgi:predicted short-subunit dehydrogenase-like oxidoreductase (DUF2520 family)